MLAATLALVWAGGAAAIPKGDARIAVDAHTGEVLVARGSLTRWYPASLTKMMTLYLLFDAVERGKTRLNSPIVISARAARQPPSRLGVGQGGRILVRDAIQALAVKSANDIAVAVAEHVAGSEAKFARRMNQTAKRLGMSRTVFRNPHGLHHSQQVTTARDMAILAVALMRDYPQYYQHFSQEQFRYGKRTYTNTNRMLGAYAGMDGIKTGYIYKSGFNLAAAVKRDRRRIVAVVMGANSSAQRAQIMTGMLEEAFERLEQPRRTRITAPLPVRLRPAAPIPRSRPNGNPARLALASAASAPAPIPVPAPILTGPAAAAGYSVQVGAFQSADEAERYLVTVLSRLPSRLGDPDPLVAKGRKFYRARLIGYDTREDAARACRWLKTLDTDCLIVAAAH